MAYDKRNWTPQTPISVDNLKAMDEAIYDNDRKLTQKGLQEILECYPVLWTSSDTPEGFDGENRQFCACKNKDGFVLYLSIAGIWHPIYSSSGDVELTDYVKNSLTIAGLTLEKPISADELQEGLHVYPLVYGASSVQPLSKNVGQLEYVGSALGGKQGLYVLLSKDDNGEQRLKLVTSDDLSDCVKTDRTIAGVDLSKDITVEELNEAIGNMPVRTTTRTVDSSFAGKVKEIVFQNIPEASVENVYICAKADTENNVYKWVQISNTGFVPFTKTYNATINSDYKGTEGQIIINYENERLNVYMCVNVSSDPDTYTWIKLNEDLSDYVKNSITIADLDLKDNISAEELQTALNTYPILRTSDLSTTKANVGQLACLTIYDGKEYTRTFYYCYGKNGNGEPLWAQVGNNQKNSGDASVHFEELNEYAKLVQNAQTPNTLTLALMADTHYCDNDNNAQAKLDVTNKMALLSNYVHIDAIANLGDFVRGDELKDITRNDLAKLIVNTNQNAKCPVFFIRGNHDDNGWYSYEGDGTYQPDEIINDIEWYQMAFGFTHKDIVIDTNKPNGGYGYFDHEKSKIRVFLLNSSDIPYILKEDGTYRYNGYRCCAFSNEQLNFVANALQFADKENPDEWAAMFLTHIPLDTTNDNGYRFGIPDALIRGHAQMLGIINAYRKGVSYSFNGAVNNSTLGELSEDFTVSVDADYSTNGVGDVICFVSGHTHTDNVSQKVGHEDSLSYGYTFLGIIGATAFATLVVNREDCTVSVFKYGEVKPQSSATTHNPGAIDGESEFGIDMSSGQWVVPFEQFRPNGENIYNGLSELWGSGYFFNNSATLNTETLELSTATVNETNKYAITKAIPIKGSTQYEIPNIGSSIVYAYNTSGTFYGGDTRIEGNILTTKSGGGYLVFAFHKSTYPDYENFYIKELINTEYYTEQNALLEGGESDG